MFSVVSSISMITYSVGIPRYYLICGTFKDFMTHQIYGLKGDTIFLPNRFNPPH